MILVTANYYNLMGKVEKDLIIELQIPDKLYSCRAKAYMSIHPLCSFAQSHDGATTCLRCGIQRGSPV